MCIDYEREIQKDKPARSPTPDLPDEDAEKPARCATPDLPDEDTDELDRCPTPDLPDEGNTVTQSQSVNYWGYSN